MGQLNLFEETEKIKPGGSSGIQAEIPPGISDILFELSVEAYYSALYASMSELPIKGEIERFVAKVIKAGKGARSGGERVAAERAAGDRGDLDVLAVLRAAGKVRHEIHRITGFLRFVEGSDGVYTASCAPDHYILPALAEHFTMRFGETPWAIIDEKRRLCLCREGGGPSRLIPWSPDTPAFPGLRSASSGPQATASENNENDSWEGLWQLYHRSINNEARKNLRLQRQLMPERYQKYLTEFNNIG